MANMRHSFSALLTSVNPSRERAELVARRTADVRDWLANSDYKTIAPHTRLSGSYGRDTAIDAIADVDVLLFLPEAQLERTPNSVLIEVHAVLKDFPGGIAETRPQRRSIRIDLSADGICLDIVPAVSINGLEKPLQVPDRPQECWIASDPLGYAERLSKRNQDNGGKLVPLIKLVKAWRDEQMKNRRPKSYVLEVILLTAVESEVLELCDRSIAENVRDFFVHVTDKYESLMDEGEGVPRIADPQTGGIITRGWERSHFETFMRRAREARNAAERAVQAEDEASASEAWRKVFGSRWPSDDAVRRAVQAEAKAHQPGTTKISSMGRVVGGPAIVPTRPTRYHGVR